MKLGLPAEKNFIKSKTSTKTGSHENMLMQHHSVLIKNTTIEYDVYEKYGILANNGRASTTKKPFKENDLQGIRSIVEQKIFAKSLSSKELLKLALEYLAPGHLDEVLPLLRLATDKDHELIRALVAMGQIYCSKGSLKESAEYFEHPISMTREEIQEEELGLLILALYDVGFSHINQGMKYEGIEHLKIIGVLEEPETPTNKVCYYRGLVLLLMS